MTALWMVLGGSLLLVASILGLGATLATRLYGWALLSFMRTAAALVLMHHAFTIAGQA